MERRRGRGSNQMQKAVELLRRELASGHQPTRDLEEKAWKAGIGLRTLRNAKQLLGVQAFQSVKEGKRRGPWFWHMPSASVELGEATSSPSSDAPKAKPAVEAPTPETGRASVEPGESMMEVEPSDPLLAEPEERMAATNEEIAKALDTIQERIGKLESRAVPVERVEQAVVEILDKRASEVKQARADQTLQEVQKGLSDLSRKVDQVDPRLASLAEKADTLTSLCELHPELCEALKRLKAPEQPKPPEAPKSPEEIHQALLNSLNEAGLRLLGRTPTWQDLLDACPGGDCGRTLVEVIAKKPEVLEHLVAQEGVADVLIEALKKQGKLVVEPEPPPGPVAEEAASGGKQGWFGRIPAPGS